MNSIFIVSCNTIGWFRKYSVTYRVTYGAMWHNIMQFLQCQLAELLKLKLELGELKKDELESEGELRECKSLHCGLLNDFLVMLIA